MIPVYYGAGALASVLAIMRLGLVPVIRALAGAIAERRLRIAESRQLVVSVTTLTNVVNTLVTDVDELKKARAQ